MSNLINVTITDVFGRPLPTHRRRSDGQIFVEVVPGTAYQISVRNESYNRVLLVPAVDGRDVHSDRPASVHLDGVVIRGGTMYAIPGWQFNQSSAGQFVFSDPSLSVANQATGSDANVGVIAVAAFREHVREPQYLERSGGYRSGGGLESFGAKSLGGDVGTGMGQGVSNVLGTTTFRRAQGGPHQTVIIRYATREWLEREGIITPAEPIAYPADQPGYNPAGFVRMVR